MDGVVMNEGGKDLGGKEGGKKLVVVIKGLSK